MRNVEIAWAFSELADLMELSGEDFFKIRAYRRAAKVISSLEEPVSVMYKKNTLASVAGLGKRITAKVGELLEKGKIDKLERLRKEIPSGLPEIMVLPEIGPKRAAFFYKNLGITSIHELENAARKGKLRGLKGIGIKTEMEIIRNIDMIKSRSDNKKFRLSLARELLSELTGYLENLSGVDKVSSAGSVRRWKEMVGDLDVLVVSSKPESVIESFAYHPHFIKILDKEDKFIRCLTRWGIQVELAVVDQEDYPLALLQKTGSKEHLRDLAECAEDVDLAGIIARGGDVSNYKKEFNSEEEIYSHLNMQYIPPELREGAGEVESARLGVIPSLVNIDDICGDLHIHSSWSDGNAPIEDIAKRAEQKGYQYIAITDHSQSLKIAGGLEPVKLREQYEYIDDLNKDNTAFRILKGIEVDILSDGELDMNDEILERADVVIASVHSGFKQDRETITSRVIKALENKHVDIIGHLTGRLLGTRNAYDIDVDKVLETAARHGKIMEINSSPDRLDLNEENARKAAELDVKIVINTDSHSLVHLDEMEYGVAVARRAGLRSSDIINTYELNRLLSEIKR